MVPLECTLPTLDPTQGPPEPPHPHPRPSLELCIPALLSILLQTPPLKSFPYHTAKEILLEIQPQESCAALKGHLSTALIPSLILG